MSDNLNSLLDQLAAIDRLNSWVRSRSFRHGMWAATLRRRIYEMKRDAMERAHGELVCRHRAVETLAICRDCGGDGRYMDSGGHQWPHCRMCGSSGTVRLRFVETRIYDAPALAGIAEPKLLYVWHSPSHTFWIRGFTLEGAAEVPAVAPDWGVNLPGREMTVDEAARDLLVCEAAFPHRYSPCRCDEYCDCTKHYFFYLGEFTSRCAHCGVDLSGFAADERADDTAMQVNRCGKRFGRVDFTFACCAACYVTRRGNAVTLFDVGCPPELLAPPHVAEWVRVNNALAADGRAA